MSEFQEAAKLWSGGLGLHVTLNPAGTWSFVGTVPIGLQYFRRDGSPLTDEDVKRITMCGAGLFRKTIGTRTWPSREEAIAEAEKLGFAVVNK
jgi:hypothetical protein